MHAPTVSTELLDEAPHLRAVSVDGEQRPVAEHPEVVGVPEVPRIAEDRDDQRVVVGALLPEADDATPARGEVLHVQRHENPEEDKRAPGQLASSAASEARQALRGGEAENERGENEDGRDPKGRPEGRDDSQERSGCESCAKCQVDLLNLDFPQTHPQDLLYIDSGGEACVPRTGESTRQPWLPRTPQSLGAAKSLH